MKKAEPQTKIGYDSLLNGTLDLGIKEFKRHNKITKGKIIASYKKQVWKNVKLDDLPVRKGVANHGGINR